MNGYFSVFDPNGKKIADCGALRDAVNLVGSRNKNWEGHYYQFRPVYDTIDVSSKRYLSSDKIAVVEIKGQTIPLQQKFLNNGSKS